MTSGAGERRMPTGEFGSSDRGSMGIAAPIRMGSAMPVIRYASGVLALLCVAAAWITMRANGVLILALVFAAVHCWAAGMFTAQFWLR